MQEHIDSLIKDTFYLFSKRITNSLESSRKFQGKILEILRRDHAKIYRAINSLNCDIISMAEVIMYQHNLEFLTLLIK